MNGEPDLYIGGQWRHASDGGTRDIVNPADGSVAAVVDEATDADARDAVARRAGGVRRRRLARDARRRPGRAARPDRRPAAARQGVAGGRWRPGTPERRWWRAGSTSTTSRRCSATTHGSSASRPTGSSTSAIPTVISRVVREPIGVCVLIAPWNYPLLQMSWKIAPALGAGCTMVAKPSEVTPLSTIAFVHLLEEAGCAGRRGQPGAGQRRRARRRADRQPGRRLHLVHRRTGHRPDHRQGGRRARHQGRRRTRRQEPAHRLRRHRTGRLGQLPSTRCSPGSSCTPDRCARRAPG